MTTLSLTFLGTAAAVPTAARNLSGLFVKRGGDAFLFDCGEGTQRQMIRFGTGFLLDAIFFTHFHADHYLGLIGMLRTFAMQAVPRPVEMGPNAARSPRPLRVFGPPPAASLLPQVLRLGLDPPDASHPGARGMGDFPYPVEIVEIGPGLAFAGQGYEVRAFATQHRVPSLGYALVEAPRPGRFDLARADALDVPRGPLFGRLQRGETVTLPDGRTLSPSDVLGPPRPGRRLVISGDTRPCEATIAAAAGADLLIHESTFGDEEAERASLTCHSTAREAARVAREAGAKRLLLTHLSSRYDVEPNVLRDQARAEMPACEVAADGVTLELPLRT